MGEYTLYIEWNNYAVKLLASGSMLFRLSRVKYLFGLITEKCNHHPFKISCMCLNKIKCKNKPMKKNQKCKSLLVLLSCKLSQWLMTAWRFKACLFELLWFDEMQTASRGKMLKILHWCGSLGSAPIWQIDSKWTDGWSVVVRGLQNYKWSCTHAHTHPHFSPS